MTTPGHLRPPAWLMETVPVSGIHLTKFHNPETDLDELQVLAEVDGKWLSDGGPISHIVEPAGIRNAPVRDPFRADQEED